MSEWKECLLGDFIELHRGYDLTKAAIVKGPYPVVCSTSIMGYHNEYKVKGPGVVIGRSGTLGEVQYVKSDYWPHNTSLYVSDFKGNDPKFVKYFLQQFGTGNVGSGSAVPTLNRNHIQALKIKVPPLAEQQRITSILSSLDDKIELNNKINRNLEEQAQALFKNWFVDFAPFGGNMPAGWKRGKLSDIAKFEKEKIEVSRLTEFSYYSTENMLPDKAGVCPASSLPNVSQTTRCYPGETIVSNIRPYFKKVYFCTEELAGCSTDVLCFKPRKASLAIYNYCSLCQDDFFYYVLNGTKGTKMPRGDKSQMMKFAVCIPPEEVLQKFAAMVAPMLQKVDGNRNENRCLAVLRNALLPKLVNGTA